MGGWVGWWVATHQGGGGWTKGGARVACPPVLLWQGAGVLRLQGGCRVVARPGRSLSTADGHIGEAGKRVVAIAGRNHRVSGGLLHVVLLPVQLEGGAEAGSTSAHLTVSLSHPADVECGNEHHEEDDGGGGSPQGDEEGGGHAGQQNRL